MEICGHWTMERCAFGRACRYRHSGTEDEKEEAREKFREHQRIDAEQYERWRIQREERELEEKNALPEIPLPKGS